MKIIVVGLILVSVLVGCEEKAIVSGPPRKPSGPPIETDPSLNFARNTIYYVHTDTLYPENNGIYRANAANPLRYKIVDGLTVTCPSASPDESKIAFLDNGLLRFYDVSGDRVSDLDIDSIFSTIFYVNGEQLIGEINNRIYLVNLSDSTVALFRDGIAPSPDRAGFFLWVYQGPGPEKDIVLTSVPLDSNETAFAYNAGEAIQAVSRYLNSDRYAFVTGSGSTLVVRTRIGSTGQTYAVTTTKYPTALLVGFDRVIFTGDDGRFYQSNFDGSHIIAYRGAEDGVGDK